MSDRVPTELRSAAMDWKDLLLFAAAFGIVVVGLTAWAEVAGEPPRWMTKVVIVGGLATPLALRRFIFGWPALPPPKEGALWSLVSMLGILAALFGVAAAALGVYPLWNGRALHAGLVGGGLAAVVAGSVLTALRYPRSNLPSARAIRQKE